MASTGGVRRKARRVWRRSAPRVVPGAAPGSVNVDPEAPRSRVRVIAYGPDGLEERDDISVAEIGDLRRRWPVVWINVDGLGSAETIRELGEFLGLHRLALEDVVNVGQRAKVEDYGDHLFIVARMVDLDPDVTTEQLSLFVGDGFLVSFQERAGDCFDPVRERLRSGRPRIRGGGPDYLAYALLDALVDGYFPVVEALGEDLEHLEDEVVAAPNGNTVSRIQAKKASLLALRRAIWPHREALTILARLESGPFADETRLHFRDVQDHALQIIDLVESYRETTTDLMSVYLSVVSNRMNEVMKLLTVIATIFIPLSFIAGVYGMNFDPDASRWNMPELGWAWGYPAVLALMAAVVVVLLVLFKRRGLL